MSKGEEARAKRHRHWKEHYAKLAEEYKEQAKNATRLSEHYARAARKEILRRGTISRRKEIESLIIRLQNDSRLFNGGKDKAEQVIRLILTCKTRLLRQEWEAKEESNDEGIN